MWTSLEWVRLVALALVARACYEASKPPKSKGSSEGVLEMAPRAQPPGGCGRNLTSSEAGDSVEGELSPSLAPQVREWKRRELRRYGEAQEKKWRKWTEAMFERRS